MGDHMPVHLGSMPMSVRAAIDSFPLGPGDAGHAERPLSRGYASAGHNIGGAVCISDASGEGKMPLATAGGTWRYGKRSRLLCGVAGAPRRCRWDLSGSMGLCREIYQEGLRIPPVRIMRAGKMDRDVLALLLNNVRTPNERERRPGGADCRLPHRG